MADDHSYDCPFCDKPTKHVPISAQEFSPAFATEIPDGAFEYLKCCECGAVCKRRVDGDQPGNNGYYRKDL